VLDYSRISRHLLVTAGDDGTVHLWDTTGRNPKVCSMFSHKMNTESCSKNKCPVPLNKLYASFNFHSHPGCG
jgi:WD40 repeat protein